MILLLFLIVQLFFYSLILISILYWLLYVFLIQHDEDYQNAMRYIYDTDHIYSIYYKLKNPKPEYDVHKDFHRYLAEFYWPVTKERSKSVERSKIHT